MTAESFAYWLQGFNELSKSAPTPEQWTVIKDHLALVFKKETPTRDINIEITNKMRDSVRKVILDENRNGGAVFKPLEAKNYTRGGMVCGAGSPEFLEALNKSGPFVPISDPLTSTSHTC